jgi:hypothetical protein
LAQVLGVLERGLSPGQRESMRVSYGRTQAAPSLMARMPGSV